MEGKKISKEYLPRINSGKFLHQVLEFKDLRQEHSVQAKLIETMSGYGSSLSSVLQRKNDSGIVQRMVRFEQPRETPVLKEKCYAYALFNALDKAGEIPAGMTQAQVDAWITTHESGTMGGGPKQVSDKLAADQTITVNSTYVQMGRKDKFRLAVKYALKRRLPVVMGVSTGSSNHWVYPTGITANSIQAEDQQNADFGVLNFTLRQCGNWRVRGHSDRGVINYRINHISIGTKTQIQRDWIYSHYY